MHTINTESTKSRKAPYYTIALATLLAIAIACVTQTTGAQASLQTSNPAVPQGCLATWSVVPSPNVGTNDNYLYSVTAISANDVWAVGAYTGTGISLTLTEHWDGTQWSIVPSPNPASAYNHIRGISAVSSNDVWAVGDYTTNPAGGTDYMFALHWNGIQWSEIDPPNPQPIGAGYWLAAVKAFAANDVWAVGYGRQSSWHSILLHWNGSTWSSDITSPSYYIRLKGIDGVTSNDLWAVGDDAYGTGQHIEHWNGSAWSLVTNPEIGPLNGVAAVFANNVWAVGNTIEHWDGSAWTVVTAPNVGVLHAIKAITTNDVWAVGDTAFLHWDGTSWSSVAKPVTGVLPSVDASASNDVWAVGSQLVGGVTRTLIEHYSSVCSTPIPTVTTSTATSAPTTTGTGTPAATSTAHATSTTNPSATVDPSSTVNPGATAPTSTDTPIATSTGETTLTPTATPTAPCAISYSDVPEGSTFYPYVRCLVCRGIVQGYSDGTYRPNAPVTRGQAAKIISNSAGWSDVIPPAQQTFNDVPPDSTFWLYAERTYQHGAMQGYPCGSRGEPCPGIYFRPSNTLTRGQIAKVAAIAANYNDPIPPTRQTFSDVQPNSTFWLYIEQVALHGVVSGYTDGTYRPQNPVTRGQIAKISANTFFPECPSQNRYRTGTPVAIGPTWPPSSLPVRTLNTLWAVW
ncbi:MAG: S-layer homology domain-containing protein [Chloroflexota bacterium]